MKKRICSMLVMLLFACSFAACHKAPASKPESSNGRDKIVKVGSVRVNPHPAGLEGKTVVLRWNGQCNGDTFLDGLAELLRREVKQVRIVKLWESDPQTAAISANLAASEATAQSAASHKPALVISAQADSG